MQIHCVQSAVMPHATCRRIVTIASVWIACWNGLTLQARVILHARWIVADCALVHYWLSFSVEVEIQARSLSDIGTRTRSTFGSGGCVSGGRDGKYV
jgi:hypothetical protein